MKKSLFVLILTVTIAACSRKAESLAGRQFHLVDVQAEKISGIMQISFINNRKMQILVVRDILGSNNDIKIAPYRFEQNKLTFGGTTYDISKNEKGYDLYREKHLVYKLIVPRGDELGKMAEDSLRRRKPTVKRMIRPQPIS